MILYYTEHDGRMTLELAFDRQRVEEMLGRNILTSFDVFNTAVVISSDPSVSSVPLSSKKDYQIIVYDWSKSEY